MLSGGECAARIVVVIGGLYAFDAGVARVGRVGASGKPCAGCRDGAGDLCPAVGAADVSKASAAE